MDFITGCGCRQSKTAASVDDKKLIEPDRNGGKIMFREMRRKKQLLSKDASIEVLERGTSGVLALLGDDDYPYAVPLSYVYADGKIYFHAAKAGHKIDAIQNSSKASFCVIDQDKIVPEEYTTYFRSVIVFGKIRLLTDETEIRRMAKVLTMKYSAAYEDDIPREIDAQFKHLAMIELDIEHMTGKEAKELAKNRTEK